MERNHRTTISAGGGVRLFVDCSCDPDAPLFVIEKPTETLDELARLADEHIRAAEGSPSKEDRP
jgi:hypothetical protein